MTEKKLRLYHVKGKIVNEYAVAENQMEAIDNVLCHPCDHAIIREMISVKNYEADTKSGDVSRLWKGKDAL